MSGSVIVKRGREKPIVNQHPWIFSGAIERVEGNPTPGDIVTVKAHDGRFLARGYWNPKSQIQVRNLTWQDEPIDEEWWRRMLRRATEARDLKLKQHERGTSTAYRLVNAENDFLPGLIVDRYDRWLVIQALTLGIDQRKSIIADILGEMFDPTGIYERSDIDVRAKEGISQATGRLWGEEPPHQGVEISENNLTQYVDVRKGQKTGHYLDQSQNREDFFFLLVIDDKVTPYRRVLNLFSYTGGFGLYALRAGCAHVVNVDSSHDALRHAEENAIGNNLPVDRALFIQADVFDYLRDAVSRNEQYDVIVCDPPKFAQSAQQVERAARGYKDLNLHCFKLIKPGGYLMTFSCSGAVSADLFQKIVFGALADSGRQAQILRHLGPGDDHPVALTFPEGAYLKGLLLRVY